MCTVVLLHRPGHTAPLLLAANRDELASRVWEPPAPHWPDKPTIVGGRDTTGGGTWLAVNTAGVVAAILNRVGSLGPAPGMASRGDLPLLALAHDSAEAAAVAIEALDLGRYRSFNLVLADRHAALVQCADGDGTLRTIRLSAGVHMITAHDPDDPASARVARHLPRFVAAPPPDRDHWTAWRTLLADRSGPTGSEMTVPIRQGFGTVCASLASLSDALSPPDLWFAPGPSDTAAFESVRLPGGHMAARLL